MTSRLSRNDKKSPPESGLGLSGARNLINRHCSSALVIYVFVRIIFIYPSALLTAISNLANEAFQSEVRRKQTACLTESH